VQKYLVLTGHIITPRLIVVNEPAWQAMAEKDRQVLKSAVATHGATQDNDILGQESKLVDTFRSGGMTIVQPDLDSFRKPVLASVPPKFESRWGKGLWERIASA
jgi:TRAP-type C4-dicarboxylate transport system substrate-binding protein